MSDDLERFASSSDPAQEIANQAGLAALGSIPLFGPFAANAVESVIAIRESQRRQAFDGLVVRELRSHQARLDSLEEAIDTWQDEFVAAWTKTSRVAAETASETKRLYLARALAQMGPWVEMDAARKRLLLDLVTRYDELHVMLLDYFRDPPGWIRRGTPTFRVQHNGMGPISGPLSTYMFPGVPDWQATARPAVQTMENDSLLRVPWDTTMSTSGTVEKRTTPLGDALLDFIAVAPGDTAKPDEEQGS